MRGVPCRRPSPIHSTKCIGGSFATGTALTSDSTSRRGGYSAVTRHRRTARYADSPETNTHVVGETIIESGFHLDLLICSLLDARVQPLRGRIKARQSLPASAESGSWKFSHRATVAARFRTICFTVPRYSRRHTNTPGSPSALPLDRGRSRAERPVTRGHPAWVLFWLTTNACCVAQGPTVGACLAADRPLQ